MSTASTPAAAPSPPRVVLGSQSVGRRQCLQRAGIAFEAMPADIDERAVTVAAGGGSRETADPQLLTLAIARAKAQALLPRLRGQDRLLITSGVCSV